MVFAQHQGHNSENLYVASFRLEFVLVGFCHSFTCNI